MARHAEVVIKVSDIPEVAKLIRQYAEDAQVYKDFYGTSVAQVKHLSECMACSAHPDTADRYHCLDYPAE